MLQLNGIELPSFVKVSSIEFSVLPPLKNNLLQVRGKAGAYHFSQDVDVRVLTVDFTIIAEEINGVMSASRSFSEWLYHTEPVKLVIQDEPDKYYWVVPDGDSSIKETANFGQGTIQFICTEPFAFGETKEESFEFENEDDVAEFFVGGTVETHPEIALYIKEDITSIAVNSDDHSTLIGEPEAVTEEPKDPAPIVLHDPMDTVTPWTTASHVDGGIISGEFTTNGNSFRVKDRDFGEGSAWHGASAIRALPNPIDDFEVHFGLGLTTSGSNQVGRVELYLLDENDVQFGKIALVDNYSTTNKNKLEARAGTWGDGTYFASGQSLPEWDGFYGRIKLTRIDNEWTVNIAQEEGGKYDYSYERSWIDVDNKWNNKLAKIQIHLGAYGTRNIASDLFIPLIFVKERLTLSEIEVPIIAKRGDIILIDNSKLVVYLNGEPRYDLINPASDFIKLNKGLNRLSVSPPVAGMNISYTERWL